MSPVRVLVLALVIGIFAVGASCDDHRDDQGAAAKSAKAASAGDEQRVSLAELHVSGIDELGQSDRDKYADLVNELLSPCGQPVSLGRCAKEGGKCTQCKAGVHYVGRLVKEGYAKSAIEEMYRNRYSSESALKIPLDESPLRGSPMAPVTIVEFSDFECPYCGAAFPVLERLVTESGGQVRMIFKQFPLDAHTHSRVAARATIAAGKQGKFWEMHDMLFQHQDALEASDLKSYAKQLGLDLDRFEKDMQAPSTEARIEKDRALGHKLGVRGTPTIYVNGHLYDEPLRSLPAYVEEMGHGE